MSGIPDHGFVRDAARSGRRRKLRIAVPAGFEVRRSIGLPSRGKTQTEGGRQDYGATLARTEQRKVVMHLPATARRRRRLNGSPAWPMEIPRWKC